MPMLFKNMNFILVSRSARNLERLKKGCFIIQIENVFENQQVFDIWNQNFLKLWKPKLGLDMLAYLEGFNHINQLKKSDIPIIIMVA